VVVTEGGGTTVRLKDLLVVSEFESITCTEKVLEPVAVGTPEITPVPGAIVNPAGRVPDVMDQV